MAKKKKTPISERIGFVDEVRGLAILLMVIYHFFFDLVVLFGVNIPLFTSAPMDFLRDLFAGLFIFISGAACRLSRSNLKRGLICFALGMCLTAFTFVFMPDELICFGILHMLGLAMILFALLHKLIDKIRFPILGILLCALLFWFTMNITSGVLGPFTLPDALTSQTWLFPIGIVSAGFSSSDYFPLFPWIFVFFAGSYFGVYLVSHRLPEFFCHTHLRPLAFVGRHTLIIYLLHQPILYAILYPIFAA